MNKTISTFLLTFIVVCLNAQPLTTSSIDLIRSSGKIYVVVLVVLVILCGLFFYVWRLDKKISKIERRD